MLFADLKPYFQGTTRRMGAPSWLGSASPYSPTTRSESGCIASSANARFGLAVTPASFGPCSTVALASAGSARASALPAPSLRNSRRRTYSDLGVTSNERMRDLRGDRTPPARAWLRFRGFRLAH